MLLTPDKIKEIVRKGKASPQWFENAKCAAEMEVHSDGKSPGKLLDERRPNEPEEAKKYRLSISVPVTKTAFSKVLNVIKRIPKANDYSVKFGEVNKKIREGESLEDYTTINFPRLKNIYNWLWGYIIKKIMSDPNALVFVFPFETEIKSSDFLKPFPNIIQSKNVWDYSADNYAVFMHHKLLNLVDETFVYRYKKDKDGGWVQAFEPYAHGLSKIPVFQLGGNTTEITSDGIVYESFLSGMKPFLDEAVREYSDLQAEAVLHIHSEKWSFSSQECNTCKGTGNIQGELKDGKQIVCQSCNGSGVKSPSPFTQIVVRSANTNMGEQATPIPPAGYITKDTNIIEVQDKRIQQHIERAYSAINFDFLANVGNVQSGDAKSLDRQELNAFIYTVASTCVHILSTAYWFINEYRYSGLISIQADREKMLPKIPVPEKFDVLSENYLILEYSAAKTAGLSAPVLKRMELDIIEKKYSNEPDLKSYVKAVKTLDPLSNVSEGDKVLILNNKGVNSLDYYISCNIETLLNKAIKQKSEFLGMDFEAQKTLIKTIAKKDYLEALKPIEAAVTGDLSGTGADAIDIQAEAQARLKGSVGGVQGILQLQESVARGITDRDAAVSLLQVIYGVDAEVAATIIGNPKQITTPPPAPQPFN